MPAPEYAKAIAEKWWLTAEGTFNTLAQPAAADAVVPLPGAAFPPALREFTPSLERTGTPGVRVLIPRKKKPAEWTLAFYAKFGVAAGTAPTYALLLKSVFGLESIVASTSVTYALATDIEEVNSLSIWHYADNFLRGFRGCKPNVLTLTLAGTEEGRVEVSGFAGNEVFAGITTVAAAVLATPATGEIAITVADARPYQVGPAAATDRIKIKIDLEVFLLKSVDYATNILTVDRAQDGTSAAAHSIGAEVVPAIPGADPDPADYIAPVTLGAIVLGTTTVRGRSFTMVLDNKLAPRIDEFGQDTLTGYRRSDRRTVTGALGAYARKQHQPLLSDLERELVEDAAITAGEAVAAGRALLTVNMDRLRLSNVERGEEDGEFTLEFTYQALESSAGNDEVAWVLT